jgi:hypothetical protein
MPINGRSGTAISPRVIHTVCRTRGAVNESAAPAVQATEALGSDCVGDCRRFDRPARKGRPLRSRYGQHLSRTLDGPPACRLIWTDSISSRRSSNCSRTIHPRPPRIAIVGGIGSWNGRRRPNGIWCAGTAHLSPRRSLSRIQDKRRLWEPTKCTAVID